MNFINLKTQKIVTPTYFKMLTGINTLDFEKALQAGYGYIEYQYPEYNKDFYMLKAKSEPTKMDGQKGRYVQEFDVIDRPLDELKANVKAKVTEKRWAIETGGITLPNGVKVLTGIEDQNRVATSIQGMTEANLDTIDFKADSGWVKLTLAELKAVSVAVTHHVEMCFARERALHEQIDTCTSAKSLEQIAEKDINEGWPSYEVLAA